jgi:hypothetical protein
MRFDAAEVLKSLANQSPGRGIAREDSAKQPYTEWSYWLLANGKSAPIYCSDRCTTPQPLP